MQCFIWFRVDQNSPITIKKKSSCNLVLIGIFPWPNLSCRYKNNLHKTFGIAQDSVGYSNCSQHTARSSPCATFSDFHVHFPCRFAPQSCLFYLLIASWEFSVLSWRCIQSGIICRAQRLIYFWVIKGAGSCRRGLICLLPHWNISHDIYLSLVFIQ